MAFVTYLTGLADAGDVGEIFVDPPDYAILNPVAPDRVNMSIVVPLAHGAPFSERLDAFFVARVKQLSHLARRVAGATIATRVRALGPLAYRVAPPAVGGVLLVGDAAGFYDPFTGEGVTLALRSAELAARVAHRVLVRGGTDFREYDRLRHDATRDKFRLNRRLQRVVAWPALADVVARRLARRPDLADQLVGIAGDFVPARSAMGPRFLLELMR